MKLNGSKMTYKGDGHSRSTAMPSFVRSSGLYIADWKSILGYTLRKYTVAGMTLNVDRWSLAMAQFNRPHVTFY